MDARRRRQDRRVRNLLRPAAVVLQTPNTPENWRGYFAAAVTPFTADGALSRAGLESYLDWLVQEGMHGIVLAGTNGEWPALTHQERCTLFEWGRSCVPDTVPLLGGCGSVSQDETLAFLDQCADLQLDGALVSIPAYVHPTDREVLAFFQAIDRHTRVPVMAYNWPVGTGRDLSTDLLSAIARLDAVAAIKNSTSDPRAFEATLRRLHHQLPVFGVMPGARGLDLLTRIGGAGCVGAAGTLGRLQPAFFEAVWASETQRALALGEVDAALMADFFTGFVGRHGHAISTFKAILRLRGLPVGPVRPPLLEVEPDGLASLRRFLEKHELV